MSRYKIYRALSIPLSILVFASSCTLTDLVGIVEKLDKLVSENVKNPNNQQNITTPSTTVSKPSGSFTSGSETNVLNKTVPSSGGTIKVESEGSPIDGLSITVPQNAYSDTRNFEVSYSPIKENNFGKYVNPITPMITIKNGGGYSKEPMTLKIPIKKNSDEFAMAFYYDAKKGKLEGIPIVDEDNNSITIETSHFSSSNMSTQSFKTKGLTDGIGNLFVSSIKESILKQTPIISTGFKPGVDDWDFQNHGSFIEPFGICAGQSVASIWYYYEKKLEGSESLHSLYDNQDSLWFDNPKGYKFASTLQKLYTEATKDNSGLPYIAQEKQYKLAKSDQSLVWKAFLTSMIVTGEPQMVGVRAFKADGSIEAGHALVAYKIDFLNGKLYVVDPNFASDFNQDRYIEFNGNNFLPYTSAKKVGDKGTTFTLISYRAKSAYFNYFQVGNYFEKLANNTIGNEYFPEVDYYYYDKDGNKKPLTDDFNSQSQKITLGATVKPKNSVAQTGNLVLTKGSKIISGEKDIPEITLTSGDNNIGILVRAINPQSKDLEWTDFKYINIKYSEEDKPTVISNGWEGTWSGSPFSFVLDKNGNGTFTFVPIPGNMKHGPGKIINAIISGKTIDAKWISDVDPEDWGTITLTLSADGTKFSGHYHSKNDGQQFSCSGSK